MNPTYLIVILLLWQFFLEPRTRQRVDGKWKWAFQDVDCSSSCWAVMPKRDRVEPPRHHNPQSCCLLHKGLENGTQTAAPVFPTSKRRFYGKRKEKFKIFLTSNEGSQFWPRKKQVVTLQNVYIANFFFFSFLRYWKNYDGWRWEGTLLERKENRCQGSNKYRIEEEHSGAERGINYEF